MKKKHLLMLVVLLFSLIVEMIPSLVTAYAETTKTVLIDEKFLNVSYDYEAQKDSNRWRITFSRQSEESNKEQRLKLKVTNEKGNVITYPTIKEMTEKDEWLIEKNYSSSMEGQLVFDLPKTTKKLYLDVQMDQQYPAENAEEQELITEENILKIEKPFVLKATEAAEKTEDSEKTSSSEKVETPGPYDEDPEQTKRLQAENKTSSDFIGPQQESVSAAVQQSLKDSVGIANLFQPYALNYTNKAPAYTTNSTGTFPTCYWEPTGQNNVHNHQGGFEKESGWDGLTSWNVAQDNHTNSYINYGGEKKNPNIGIRKYASETSDKDEFNIRLNVRGNSISKPGVDVYFVLDNSNSMQSKDSMIEGQLRKTLAVQSLQKLITRFTEIQDSDYIRIGGGIYSDYQVSNYHPTFALSDNPSNWQNMLNQYQSITPNGNTYTQRALLDGQMVLNNAGDSSRRKLIFLLTDGGPNRSMVPVRGDYDSNIYYDGIRIKDYDTTTYNRGSQLGAGDGVSKLAQYDRFGNLVPVPYPMMGDKKEISSHLTMVNSSAADMKDSGIEIHSVAIGIKPEPTRELHTQSELVRGMYKIASKKLGAIGDEQDDYFFYHATKSGDFDLSLNDWFTTVVQTVDKGKIEDPIGDMFELVGTPKLTEVTKSGVPAIETSKMPNLDYSDRRKIKVNNINLYANQEIQLDYTVRLKTDDPNYEDGKWYQTNGRTTLEPTPERTTDKLDFGVPSVRGKAKKVEIPVEKKWSDSHLNTEDYWGLRAHSVKVVLQRKSGSSWVDVESTTLNASNGWKDTFTADGGNTVYRVVEPSRTTGYAKPISNVDEFTAKTLPSKGVQITNKLLKGTATICKYKEDGKTPFSGDKPKFSVKRKSDGKVLATDLEPDASGQVTISDIPLGDFIVEESYVPQGYTKMDDIDLKAVENSAGTGLNITLNGQKSPYKVVNKLAKDLEIPVEKIWSDSYQGTDNYWGLRTSYVRVTLQKRSGTSWENVETLTLTPIDQWKGVFQGVEGGSSVYRVVEEARTTGYGKPTYNYSTSFTAANVPPGGVKLTNKLLTGKAVICKYMDDGKTPFSKDKPKFTVKRQSDGKVLAANLEPDANGQVTITDIPMGDFIVEESYVPTGYEKMADIELKAVENSAGDALVITLNGKASPYKVTNKMADFTLKIKKVDQSGNELRGASFRLVGTSYDQTRAGGPNFEFTGLRPGEYSLSETVVPNGYQGMDGTVRISISSTGNVTIQSNSSVSGSGGLGNPNLIQLTVTNKKRGAGPLPSTGGSGTAMFFKVAIGVISTAGGLLGSLYWLHTKRRGS